jgi:uncharacterized caspase-like protein
MAPRIALVIGNAVYEHAPELLNPGRDARAIAEALKELNFEVHTHTDVTNNSMEDALHLFNTAIRGTDAAVFFFVGHGIQVKGQNYLIPIDARIIEERHLDRRTFSLTQILQDMERRANHSLLFIDACRDNPFRESFLPDSDAQERAVYAVRAGLAPIVLTARKSSFIAFATSPDTVALDAAGIHSPFTTALLQHIRTPNISVSDLMIEVRNSVLKLTNGRQRPWDQSSLLERFCFNLPRLQSQVRSTEAGEVITVANDDRSMGSHETAGLGTSEIPTNFPDDLLKKISEHLPLLRSYATALTGDQSAGDQLVYSTLEALARRPSIIKSEVHDKVALYKLFSTIKKEIVMPTAIEPLDKYYQRLCHRALRGGTDGSHARSLPRRLGGHADRRRRSV